MNEFKLKNNMLLGVASAATQVDGGELDHSWNDWYKKGHIKDGSDPAVATGHWERWREDVLLMHRMGIQTYRFGVEWARVEPREGEYDEEEFKPGDMVAAAVRDRLPNVRGYKSLYTFKGSEEYSIGVLLSNTTLGKKRLLFISSNMWLNTLYT